MIKEVTVPDIGNYTNVEVIEVAVATGSKVNVEDTLITLETEKASMDVPSPVSGVIKEMKIKAGDKVSKGDLIALIDTKPAEKVVNQKPINNTLSSLPTPTVVITEEVMITVQDLGTNKYADVVALHVKADEEISQKTKLVTLRTETGNLEILSPYSGKIGTVIIKVGDKIVQHNPILTMFVKEFPHAEKSTKSKAEPKLTLAAAETNVADLPSKPETLMPPPNAASTKSPELPLEEPAKPQETVTVKVPDTGGVKQVEVIEIAVKPGDNVDFESTLITLESEKASMDIPSPYSGKIQSVLVKVGDKVTMGDSIVEIIPREKGSNIPTSSSKFSAAETEQASSVSPAVSAHQTEPQIPSQLMSARHSESLLSSDEGGVHAGPATRRLARELGVDLAKISGSGRKNRIVSKDIKDFVKSVMQNQTQSSPGSGLTIEAFPEIDFSKFGEIEVKPLSRVKKWTGKNLHRNWVNIPHITQFDEADITELESFRQENKQVSEDYGIKLTPLPFIMKAVLSALKTYPQFNASLASNGTDLVIKKYYHIGVAVDTPNGLVVPVIQNVDLKGLFDLAKEIGDLSQLARNGKLKQDQMQGSCFTISSLGSVGGTAFTPIINAPDVAILGISKVQIKPIYINNKFVPRKMLPLSLSYDHRVIDGVEGAKFIGHIVGQLQDIRKLLL